MIDQTRLPVEVHVFELTAAAENSRRRADVLVALPVPVSVSELPHDELIAEIGDRTHTYVRKAECSAFSSIWLIGGVSYFDDSVEVRRRAQHIETTRQGDAQ